MNKVYNVQVIRTKRMGIVKSGIVVVAPEQPEEVLILSAEIHVDGEACSKMVHLKLTKEQGSKVSKDILEALSDV